MRRTLALPLALSLVRAAGLGGLAVLTAASCTSKPTTVVEASGDGCSLEWRAEPIAQAEEAQIVAPFSLTASDGTGLRIVAVEVRAVVEDPLAFTELRLVFQNPEPRQIEGRFEINLPSGAAVSRFAMLVGDHWQEAEVVELQAARQAYEDFLHRRQDPALLEKNAGNSFSARVFPIPANATKELILSYSEELPAKGEPYRLLFRGLPELQTLDVDVIVPREKGPTHLRMRKQKFTPQQDLELQVEARPAEVGLRFDRLAVARVAPVVDLPQEPLRGLTLLFDTSASRALDFKGQVARLGKIVDELRTASGDFDLRVVCFDQSAETVFAGKASSFSGDAQQVILTRGALGASDLAGALRWLGADKGGPSPRVLVVSDGIVTAGETEADAIRAAALDLQRAGVTRIDAIVDGGIQDAQMLAQLTNAGLPQAGIVANARQAPALLASRLLRSTLSGVKVQIPGAAWVWPETLDAVQPGDTFLIFADLPPNSPMRIELGDKGQDVHEIAPKTSARPLLERAWVGASIGRLTAMLGKEAAGDEAKKAEIRKQILDLSTKFRVLSDYTALLVLETEWDYQRFGIDRTALAEIMTVGPDGIAVVDRTQLPAKSGIPAIAANNVPAGAAADGAEVARPEPDDVDTNRRKMDAPAGDGGEGEAFADRTGDFKRAEAPAAAPTPVMEAAPVEAAPPPSDDMPVAREGLGKGGGSANGSGGDSLAGLDLKPEPEPARVAPKRTQSTSSGVTGRRHLSQEQEIQRLPIATPTSTSVAAPWQPPRPQPTFERPKEADPYDGRYREIMIKGAGDPVGALADAWAWRTQSPSDELAILALGEASELAGDRAQAARAYGSLIDLFPGRADIRRMAGERLESLGDVGLPLAVDTYAHAVQDRPDHPSSHRLYAYALLKAGKPAEAFAAALAGARRSYPWGRFAGVPRILEEDLRLIAAAWLAQRPGDREAIMAELTKNGVVPDTQPSTRFVLNWETDANDVDFHIYDGKGGHAYYSQKLLPSAGELYADVTTGYGPECFTIPGVAAAYPYLLQAHYYSRGPMGYGMGKLEVIEHDGKGGLRFAENPFVIMKDSAFVDLGRIDAPLSTLKMTSPRLMGGPQDKNGGGGGYTPPPPTGLGGTYSPPPPEPIRNTPPPPIPVPPPEPIRNRPPPPT
ncbi:MAG: VIT domain-containing protein [Nannocystaceae bacterium]